MNDFNRPDGLVILNINEVPVTTSLKVAEAFGKNHFDVMKAVRNLECSVSFIESNFALKDRDVKVGYGTKKSPYYELTRDGYTFLVQGFTGKKAAQFKERYIQAFNAMEEKLSGGPNWQIPKTLSEALQLAADQAKQLEIVQPKAEAWDALGEQGDNFNLTDAAYLIGQNNPNLFWDYIRENTDIMYKNYKGDWAKARQRYLDAGYFKVVANDDKKGVARLQTMVTKKGLEWLKRRFGDLNPRERRSA